MKLLPIVEKLEDLRSNSIYGPEIVDAIYKSELNIYFYYDGFIGLTNVENYSKDFDQEIIEITKFEGYLMLDTQAYNFKNNCNIIRSLNLDDGKISIHSARMDKKLVFLLKGPRDIKLPNKFGTFYSENLSSNLIRGLSDLLINQSGFLYLCGNANEFNMKENLNKNNKSIDHVNNEIESSHDSKEINDYIKKLMDLNEEFGIKYPKKIEVIFEAFFAMYIEKRYHSNNEKVKHKNLFELCSIDLRKKYELTDSFLEELERITNPKPQYPIVNKLNNHK